MTYIEKIKELDACEDALKWLREKNYPTLQDAWDNCPRGDWMLWLLDRTVKPDADKLPFVRIAAACARPVLPYYEALYPGDNRPRNAIEATERYASDPTEENREAARAASAAADAAARDADAAASYAAARAASAAADAADAAADAADAAYAAAYAAEAAYAADAADAADAEQAKIIRQHFPKCPELY